MQAHALTPRMVSALTSDNRSSPSDELPPPNDEPFQDGKSACTPELPFLSVLASGGHTLLIHSASLTDHRVLGTTQDIAIGECLDKIARVVLPAEILQTTKSTMYGALLEAFALPDLCTTGDVSPSVLSSTSAVYSAETYLGAYGHRYDWYEVSSNHEEAMRRSPAQWGWALNRPLTTSGGGVKINSLEMSFSGITTMVERIVRFSMDPTTRKLNKIERAAADVSVEERKDLAKETMRVAFEHIASRVILALQSLQNDTTATPAVVMAGGVASNSFLRHMQVSPVAIETVHANLNVDLRVLYVPMDIPMLSFTFHHRGIVLITQR
jgi:N6-L-threonylcarbamoyladenine synthase